MKAKIAALVFLVSGAMPALAAEQWSCSYRGFVDPEKQIKTNLIVHGAVLRATFADGTLNPPFHILENNSIALVAAQGGAIPAWQAPEAGMLISGSILIVKKDTGAFTYGSVSWRKSDDRITDGHCRKVS